MSCILKYAPLQSVGLDGVDELVAANYPQIAAVGMASAQGRDNERVVAAGECYYWQRTFDTGA